MSTQPKLKPAVVRAMFPCYLIVMLSSAEIYVAMQKMFGMPTSLFLDHSDKNFTANDVLESAHWEFGLDDVFVLSFPKYLIDDDISKENRNSILQLMAKEYVQAELQRKIKSMNLITINPIFGAASYSLDPRLAFVLMPFDDDLTEIYKSLIKPTVEEEQFNLVCKRADDYKTNKAIMHDIWKAICESRLIIADLTRLNPNVMYELGIAHTVGKETILIYQKPQEIRFPFDIGHIRRIEYTNDAIGGRRLQDELRETLKSILQPRTIV